MTEQETLDVAKNILSLSKTLKAPFIQIVVALEKEGLITEVQKISIVDLWLTTPTI